MHCPNCQSMVVTELEAGSNVCGDCGFLFGLCPKCGAIVREDILLGKTFCHKCGTVLLAAGEAPARLIPSHTQTGTRPRSTADPGLVFFIALVAPATIATFGALLKIDTVVWVATFVGSGLAGLICGNYAARSIKCSVAMRAFLVVLFTIVFAIVSLMLCFAGCSAFAKK